MKKQRFNWYLRVGGLLTLFMTSLILLGCFWTPCSPTAMSGGEKLRPPSLAHIMGTDNFGRDIFSRVLQGAGTTFLIAAAAVAIGAAIGVVVGVVTGYFGGIVDEVIMRFNDALAAFPHILLALVLISVLGSGKYNIIVALGILFIPSFARIVRSEVVRCKGMDYVENARLYGSSPLRIMLRQILPNLRTTLLSTIAIGFNNAVLAEASMSYLGLGVQPPDASLGRMLSESQTYLLSAPWYTLCTGLAIVLLILGWGLLGEGLDATAGGD